jgi:peptidyl-prolyl cis-trans isomerase SurA
MAKHSRYKTDQKVEPIELLSQSGSVLSRTVSFALAIALAFYVFIASPNANAQIVVMVNGSPVTAFDIEQRMKFNQLVIRTKQNRQDVTQELIDERLKLFIAKRYGIEVEDSDVERTFESMARRSRSTTQLMTQSLAKSGISINTLKAKIRADTAWNQLVRGRFGASLQVGDADVDHVLQARGDQNNTTDYVYTLYPITVVVPREASNSVLEGKRRTAENLRNRFLNCTDGLRLARALRDIAVREPITRSSADLTPQLREMLGGLELGRLTSIETTPQGLQMFALCDKKQTSDSAAKREVKNEIFSKRFEARGKKFLDEVRASAMIEYR